MGFSLLMGEGLVHHEKLVQFVRDIKVCLLNLHNYGSAPAVEEAIPYARLEQMAVAHPCSLDNPSQ